MRTLFGLLLTLAVCLAGGLTYAWRENQMAEPNASPPSMAVVRMDITPKDFVTEAGMLSEAELSKINYSFHPDGYPRYQQPIIAQPSCAFRCNGGLLIGLDMGEWGGELVFQDEKQRPRVLLRKNIHAIHSMPFGLVATVGLAHMSFDYGELYLIPMGPWPAPQTKHWKTLPGAPRQSGVLKNGDLFISCSHGDVLISPSGVVRSVK